MNNLLTRAHSQLGDWYIRGVGEPTGDEMMIYVNNGDEESDVSVCELPSLEKDRAARDNVIKAVIKHNTQMQRLRDTLLEIRDNAAAMPQTPLHQLASLILSLRALGLLRSVK